MKHGIVELSAEGVPTFTEGAGVMNYLTDALTTSISLNKAPVGYAALVQRVALAVGGNVLATASLTQRVGVSAFGKTIHFGS